MPGDRDSSSPRVVTSPAELYALAPGSVILEDVPGVDPEERQAFQRRGDGSWVGAYLTVTPERMCTAPGWRALVLHEAAETRDGNEIAEAMAPAFIEAVRAWFAETHPDMAVTVRRSRKKTALGHGPSCTYVNVQWESASDHPRSMQALTIEREIRRIGEELGVPLAYVNIRRKMPKKAITAAEVRKIVKATGYRTIADAYTRSKGYAYVQITQYDTSVTVDVNMNPLLENDAKSLRAADEIAEALTTAGYTVSRPFSAERVHLDVTKPVTEQAE